MSRWLLIDLDGVVRQWDPRFVNDLEQKHGLPTGSVAAAAFGDQSLLRQAVTGQITDEEWRAKVAQRLTSGCGKDASEVVTQWSAPVGVVDPDVLSVIRDARRAGWRVGLLSNATTRLQRDLTRLELHAEFDAVVNSADLGVAKPDVAAFLQACARVGADPEESLFVDDSATNVEGAAKAGLSAHVFKGTGWLAGLLGLAPITK